MFKNDLFDKNELRRRLIEIRRGIADKPARSAEIARRALSVVFGNVMVYVSMSSEADTTGIIAELFARGATVYAPYTQNGIITPRPLVALGSPDKMGNLPSECYGKADDSAKIDCCLTPLVGFNPSGYRIGYGKGCYDRFLSEHKVFSVGLAFAEQQINFVPESHDVPLDCCVTDKNVIYF